jgi:hypothetical protein
MAESPAFSLQHWVLGNEIALQCRRQLPEHFRILRVDEVAEVDRYVPGPRLVSVDSSVWRVITLPWS